MAVPCLQQLHVHAVATYYPTSALRGFIRRGPIFSCSHASGTLWHCATGIHGALSRVFLLYMQVLVMDNRGVGRSSMPRNRRAYTSTSMAFDVLCIMVSHQGVR